ncbi:serine/threonine protein kinase [Nostocales cyanobacterium HT-58-2]|nr:serine/threonine protein kinase [Nostocales cyanobacterium HT-58-2]
MDISQQTQLGQICGSKLLFRDRYQILQILGRGGFGITFLAKDAVLPGNPFCVIKQLCPKVTSHKNWEHICKRFEKEAKTLSQLGHHFQIPMLLDYFEVNTEFYLVQEYVGGLTLAREIQQTASKSETAVKRFLGELLPVLQYLHKNHVIHRDIKPHNLLRCQDDGRLVLIDFGAVKEELVCASETLTDKTANTNFVGTIGFAPPEQFCLRPVYASDIYAVGVTCLYLLTGKQPLEFEQNKATGGISWQQEVSISEYFAQILDKMLKISLEERYKSVDDVMWALGMESYLPTLSDCLSTQRLGDKTRRNEKASQEYLSPAARKATAIREWKTKVKSRKTF